MMRYVWILLLLAAFPAGAGADDNASSYVQITVMYRSMYPGHIQVRDEVCREPSSIECEKARIKATGDRCRRKPSLDACQEARALLDSTLCVAGLLYEGRISRGEEVVVRACKSNTGYGNISVRNTMSGEAWTNYPLKTDGAQISYP